MPLAFSLRIPTLRPITLEPRVPTVAAAARWQETPWRTCNDSVPPSLLQPPLALRLCSDSPGRVLVERCAPSAAALIKKASQAVWRDSLRQTQAAVGLEKNSRWPTSCFFTWGIFFSKSPGTSVSGLAVWMQCGCRASINLTLTLNRGAGVKDHWCVGSYRLQSRN